jgi:uncharacterized protein (DUF488 family)
VIYTFGYYGKALNGFKEKVQELGAMVIDIRLVPQSRFFPAWKKKNLQAVFGGNYRQVQQLGNKSFKEKRIEIADMETGLYEVESLSVECDLILLCACKYEEKCHRKVVADALRERGYEVKELD